MRNFIAFFAVSSLAQYQVYTGAYFGCRDNAVCIQMEFLDHSRMRLEAFVDSGFFGGPRAIFHFPEVHYSWVDTEIHIAAQSSSGFKYDLSTGLGQACYSPWDITLATYNTHYQMLAYFIDSLNIHSLGTNLMHMQNRVDWLAQVRTLAYFGRWSLSYENEAVLYSPLENAFAQYRINKQGNFRTAIRDRAHGLNNRKHNLWNNMFR